MDLKRLLLLLVLLSATFDATAGSHPVIEELRAMFPALPLHSKATFAPHESIAVQRAIPGLRAQFGSAVRGGVSVTFPRSYDGLLVAESGSQRIVLRAIGASGAPASASNGMLVYVRAYSSVDVVQVPNAGRSEELLLLRDERAPLVFDYEIVASEGIESVALDDGGIRFVPDRETRGAQQQVLRIERPWLIDAKGTRSETHARWSLVGSGPIPDAIRLSIDPQTLVYPIVVDPSFSATGSLADARILFTMTLLPTGKVLVAGGFGSGALRSIELYDVSTGLSGAAGNMIDARGGHTATLLKNGKVLIAGGDSGIETLSSAELYDPARGTFEPAGPMIHPHDYHSATLLPSGEVLIVGGMSDTGSSDSAEIYDPVSGTFRVTGAPIVPRHWHTATLLRDGRVLVAGGSGIDPEGPLSLLTAEIYDPATGQFSTTGELAFQRHHATATLLPNGKVLIAGGQKGEIHQTAELYDPLSGTFQLTEPMNIARTDHAATLLPNGKVLLVAGSSTITNYDSSASLFDPATGTFAGTDPLTTGGRYNHRAVLLPDGRVLVGGGQAAGATLLTSLELYDASVPSLETAGNLVSARVGATSTLLPDGRVLLAGGTNGAALRSAELFDPSANAFAATGSLAAPRAHHTATLLTSGKVFIAGGETQPGATLASAELYDPATGAFAPAGSLGAARSRHTATLLSDGKVLVAGGYDGSYLGSAVVFDPAAGAARPTGNLGVVRVAHTATLLRNGKVLIAGGFNGTELSSAELYDPRSGAFIATGDMSVGRVEHTATLLPNGKVLIVGGDGAEASLATAELYDPESGTFSPAATMARGRNDHSATLLPNGMVLIAGGELGNGTSDEYEIYDPARDVFLAAGSLAFARGGHVALVLRDGRTLIAGGATNAAYVVSAELFDHGANFADVRRPVITAAPATMALPARLTLSGRGFEGDSENGGTPAGSASNAPLLRLQRIDNDEILLVIPGSVTSDVAWSSAIATLRQGAYRAALVSNAVPSIEQIILITHAKPVIGSVSPNRGLVTGGEVLTITGTNLRDVVVTLGGYAATVAETTSTTAKLITPPHPPGVVDVVVTSVTGASATASDAYTYVALAPTNVVATADTTSSVTVTWTPPADTIAYQVLRSSDGTTFTPIAGVSDTTFTDLTVEAGKSYLFAVRVTAPSVSDRSVPDLATTILFADDPVAPGLTAVKATHVTQLRSAVTAVRALAGQSAPSLTDPTVSPRVTLAKAVHLAELRTALNAARSALGLPAFPYSRPSPLAGTPIRAADLNDLRNAAK